MSNTHPTKSSKIGHSDSVSIDRKQRQIIIQVWSAPLTAMDDATILSWAIKFLQELEETPLQLKATGDSETP